MSDPYNNVWSEVRKEAESVFTLYIAVDKGYSLSLLRIPAGVIIATHSQTLLGMTSYVRALKRFSAFKIFLLIISEFCC